MTKLHALYASALLLCTGCASLHGDVLDKVKIGDSKADVVEALGQPDTFSSDGADKSIVYYGYKSRKDSCAIAFRDEKVVDTSCQRGAPQSSTAGAMLGGIGNGLTSSSRRPVRTPTQCISNTVGGLTNTSCN